MQGNTEACPDRLRAFWLHAFNSMAQKVDWEVRWDDMMEFFFPSCNNRFTVYSEYQPCYELLHTRYYSLIYPLFIYWCAVGYLISTLKDGEKTDKNTPGPLFFSFISILSSFQLLYKYMYIYRKTSRNKAWRRYIWSCVIVKILYVGIIIVSCLTLFLVIAGSVSMFWRMNGLQ